MAVEQLNFQGINRAISDFSNGGACEELINLRPTGTGLVPVKPFTVMMTGVSYDKLYIHKTGAISNYIAVKLDEGTLYFYWVSEEGEELATLSEISVAGYEHFSVDHVHFAYTGNYILFSICDKEDDFYKNIAFLWDATEYKTREAEVPELSLNIVPDTAFVHPLDIYSFASSVDEACREGFAQAIARYKNGCFGCFIVAAVLKTNDGKVLQTCKWDFFDPVPTLRALYPTLFSNGYYVSIASKLNDGESYAINAVGIKKITVSLSMSPIPDEDTSILGSVEIYASQQIPYVDFDAIERRETTDTTTYWKSGVLKFKEAGLDNQLLYLQKSIPIGEFNDDTPYEFDLEFGGSIQATGKTLEVDAGAVTRFGDLLAYNARFHFFDSTKKVNISMPSFVGGDGYYMSHYVFVVYNDGKKDITVYVGTEDIRAGGANVVIAPFTNIKRVITQRLQSGALYVTRQYEMAESQRYNYSICTDGGTAYTRSFITGVPSGTIFIDEPDAINVTEQYNPFVFKVEHSYLAPGAVLDVQPQMMAVKDVTYGDYPLNVFTNRGLYALLQGNGTVLYGNFRSISNLISTGNAVPTEMGTFFLAAGELWLIAGDSVVLVSDALSRGPHMFVRDAPGHYEICHDTYDILPYLSAVSFEEFTKETNLTSAARLVYNRYRDELMVCNKDFKYCYVLSLKYRQWFKMAQTFSQDMIGEIAFSGAAVYGVVESEGRPAKYSTVTLSFTIGDNTYTCEHYVGEKERTLRNLAVAMTNDCRASFAGTPLAEITFHAQEISSGFRFYVVIPGIEDPQSVVASLFKIVERDETISFTGSFSFSVGRNVVSFEDEDELSHEILVHLQTRPFSIGYQYIHIHRIIAMIRTMLASGHLIVNALYGSDDLQNWELIAYASRKNAQISQIRTPSAARSWRYYTVCIGGHVHWDTDFGTVMFDYQPVVRRIG